MSGNLVDKVFIGLDNAPAAFDIKARILGPNGTNLEYIRSETGVVAVLKTDPLHLALVGGRSETIASARSLAQNLIETIRAELAQWSAAQAGGPPPALNVPPPALTTSAPPPIPAPPASVALSTASSVSTTPHPSVLPPVVSVASASAPLMTVRQPTVLQFLPQQQYVLNQESGQLIPIVQPGVQVSNPNFTSMPIAQPIGTLQQPNFGTQFVDLSGMQHVNLTPLRLSGVPSSMSMILQNNLALSQANLTGGDTTTVSTATATPVVCAAQNTNSSHKILYSNDKGEKEIRYVQGGESVQWTVPGPQTMLIPYQQLQDLAGGQHGLNAIQPQQFVSIAPGGIPQTSLPLTATQLQQLQATGTIMHLNQKPIVSSGSLINIISTGQASSPQVLSNPTTNKNVGQEQRGQKRMSDGTPSQLQLRPIAPAGSHVSQDKSGTRDTRSWTSTANTNTAVSMGTKLSPAHGTVIHVSSGQQTILSTGGIGQDGSGMYLRQVDKNTMQLQANKDKQDNKLQPGQNVQMITVPQGMTVLQNPLNIGQMSTVLGQNGQVYMIPANQSNLVQGALPSMIGQQVLHPGQNVTVMQPNQLTMPNGVQYNVPIMPVNVPPGSQYMSSGINLNAQLSAQQINALTGQQPNFVPGTIPIVQAPPTSVSAGQTIPLTQPPPQIVAQNAYPNAQFTGIPPPQYMVQAQQPVNMPQNPSNVQYSVPQNQANPVQTNGNTPQNTPQESETPNGNNQTNYISSSSNQVQESYPISQAQVQNQQQNFAENQTPATTGYTNPSSYPTNGNQNYSNQGNTPQLTNYPANQTPQQPAQNFASAPNNQTNPQTYSPSTTPGANQTYPTPNIPNQMQNIYPPANPQNPYPNATGQNMATYANNQYPYTSRPWFRPRYGSPQGSPYNTGAVSQPMSVPPPGNYAYWQDS